MSSGPGNYFKNTPHQYIYFIQAKINRPKLTLVLLNTLHNFYSVNLMHFNRMHVFSITENNSVDPDEMALSEAS